MSLVKPLFVASITSLTLMMINTSSNINLLQQMGILPTLGTCSNWCLQVGGAAPTARRSSHCCRTVSSATATPPCMILSFSCMSFATVITHTIQLQRKLSCLRRAARRLTCRGTFYFRLLYMMIDES